jgi:hypothetical protein
MEKEIKLVSPVVIKVFFAVLLFDSAIENLTHAINVMGVKYYLSINNTVNHEEIGKYLKPFFDNMYYSKETADEFAEKQKNLTLVNILSKISTIYLFSYF